MSLSRTAYLSDGLRAVEGAMKAIRHRKIPCSTKCAEPQISCPVHTIEVYPKAEADAEIARLEAERDALKEANELLYSKKGILEVELHTTKSERDRLRAALEKAERFIKYWFTGTQTGEQVLDDIKAALRREVE